MKRHDFFFVILVGLSVVVWSCSDLKKDLPSPVSSEIAVHPDGWIQQGSADFHGTYLKAMGYDTRECKQCHGSPLSGGTSKSSCFSCHTVYPHTSGWTQIASANFHGRFLKAMNYNATDCQPCHGTDYRGGSSQVSCFSCHTTYPHSAAWATGHGVYLKTRNWTDTECQACHGSDYAGGTSGVACFTCHDAYPHEIRFAAGGHPSYLYQNGYPLIGCKTCHGTDYAGGTVGASCMQAGCHVDRTGAAKSPEACNTCHGDFRGFASDLLSAAPPKGVLGDTAQTYRGVGAHAKHLLTGSLGKAVKCQECHVVPVALTQAGHITDKLPAEVVMNDTLARLVTADGAVRPSPMWDGTQCSNTYCHGTWKLRKATSAYPWMYNTADSVMVGSGYSPVWTGGSSQTACGSCHGLPPQGHITSLGQCVNCHSDVVDASMNIIDPARHMNGMIDVLTVEIPMH
jgi:predicted CxxxxCH...CXXCH cytochrome family protein